MQAPDYILRNRHNKTARGMTITLYRSNHKLSSEASTLSVRGTLAKSSGLSFRVERKPCSCCGCKCQGKLALNANGRAALRRARQRITTKNATIPTRSE